jgi:hypothetical protein
MYINNSPGLKIGRLRNMKGLIPSIVNDVSQLNPDSIIGLMNGYSVPGVDIQQCTDEHFENYNYRRNNIFIFLIFLGISLCLILVIFFDKKI